MTPDELRRQAADLRARADEWREVPRLADAVAKLRAAADAADAFRKQLEAVMGLRSGESSANLRPKMMTQDELAMRGRAIAAGKAKDSGDAFWMAVCDSKWGSIEVYARKRLKRGASTVHDWRKGTSQIPRPMADKIRADFPDVTDAYWQTLPRKGIRE